MVDEALHAELEGLRKRLEHEQRARLEAEAIAAQDTRELHKKHRKLTLLHDIVAAANNADSVDGALQVALDRFCEYTGWPVGHVYLVAPDSPSNLISTTLWHLEIPGEFAPLRAITEATHLTLGQGLPG